MKRLLRSGIGDVYRVIDREAVERIQEASKVVGFDYYPARDGCTPDVSREDFERHGLEMDDYVNGDGDLGFFAVTAKRTCGRNGEERERLPYVSMGMLIRLGDVRKEDRWYSFGIYDQFFSGGKSRFLMYPVGRDNPEFDGMVASHDFLKRCGEY